MAVQSPVATTALVDSVAREEDRRWILHAAKQLPFLADITPADLLITVPTVDAKLMVVAEAKPTVRESFYSRSLLGTLLEFDAAGAFAQALETGQITPGAVGKVVNGQPMSQSLHPLRIGDRTIGVVVVERSLYDELKHTEEKRQLYRTSITRTVSTLLELARTTDLVPPAILPGDALMLVNDAGLIQHASHAACNIARRMGLPEALEGLQWEEVFYAGRERRAVGTQEVFAEVELLAPRMAVSVRKLPLVPSDAELGALLVLRDITELKAKDRELAIKEAIIREVHHRVKNNLQTIAALLRLQQRRNRNTEVKAILGDCIDRIASIALVHEYLSHEDVEVVDLKELAYNLLSASLQSMVPPEKEIDARVVAPTGPVTLTSSQATSVALIINELLQNTFKHAFTGRSHGRVELTLASPEPERMAFSLHDDGIGLPRGFDPAKDGNLGWEIINTLARQDLQGDIQIDSSAQGTTVTVTLPVTDK